MYLGHGEWCCQLFYTHTLHTHSHLFVGSIHTGGVMCVGPNVNVSCTYMACISTTFDWHIFGCFVFLGACVCCSCVSENSMP